MIVKTALKVVSMQLPRREQKAKRGEVVVELLAEIQSLSERINKIREDFAPVTEHEEFESRVRSVHANLAIEEPDVTIEEVREVLSRQAGE